MSRALPTIVKFAYALALIVLAGSTALTCRDFWGLRAKANRVAHTREVIAELRDTRSQLESAESAQRGYLLTEERGYLEHYEASIAALGIALDRLATLTVDNPRQQADLKRLRTLATERIQELRRTIGVLRCKGLGAAAVLTRKDKTAMDGTRQVIGAMEQEEQRLLTQRIGTHRAAVDQAIASALSTTGTVIALLLAVAALVRSSAWSGAVGAPEAPSKSRIPRPPGKRRRAPMLPGDSPHRSVAADNGTGVLAIIAVAVLALCAVLLVVSRF